MKTKEEIKDWLLENCIDEDGDLDLSKLDFSDFDGDVNINDLKVKKNLFQSFQKVEGYLFQDFQKVKGNLTQNYQKVQGELFQNRQEVKGDFITQTLKEDEEYKINQCNITCIVKKTKKLTYEEMKKIVGYNFEIVEE